MTTERVRDLAYVRDGRHLPWVRVGMRVLVADQAGVIVGSSNSDFPRIKFDNERRASGGGFHPWSMIAYFRDDGTLIADFRPFKNRPDADIYAYLDVLAKTLCPRCATEIRAEDRCRDCRTFRFDGRWYTPYDARSTMARAPFKSEAHL